jgi:hypothetical protein
MVYNKVVRIGNFNEIIRQSQSMVTAYEWGVEPIAHSTIREKKDLAILFGHKFVDSKEAEARHQESLENRVLVYDEDKFDQYTKQRYHTDIKPWLDYIEEKHLPLELYKTEGKTKWHDGNYNWSHTKAILYRLLDTETKYMVDFELFNDEFGVDEENVLKGVTCHIKYIHAKKEDQKGYFVLTKTVQRVAKLLFSQGIIQLNGWCFPMNDKEVHTNHNWRKAKVYGTARDGTKSDTKQTKLFWLYMYQGWVVTGQKQGDALISYFSKKLYDFCIASGMDIESKLMYARNFSHEY